MADPSSYCIDCARSHDECACPITWTTVERIDGVLKRVTWTKRDALAERRAIRIVDAFPVSS